MPKTLHLKNILLTGIISIIFLNFSCKSKQLKEPVSGKKPGAVAFGIFMATQKFGKKIKLGSQMPSIRYVQYAEITSSGYKNLSIKGNDEVYIGNLVAESNFDPGKTYTLSYVEKIHRSSNRISIMKYFFNPLENAKLLQIQTEPGKIKFLGVFCAFQIQLEKGGLFKKGKKAFGLVPGIPVIDAMKGARYPQSVHLKNLKRTLFGKYEVSNRGAEKHFLDKLMKRNKTGYWYTIASKQRQNL